MKRYCLLLSLGLIGFLSSPGAAFGSADARREAGTRLVIDDVTVVDTRTGSRTPHSAVVIEGDRIVRIGRAGSVKAATGVKVIDARGKFVVPGYADMHAHILSSDGSPRNFDLLLVNGVTSFRQMSGSVEMLERRRAGTLLPAGAPRLLAMPGDILTAANAATPDAAIATVRAQKAAGADFIKVVDVPPASFVAAEGESHASGLSFVGHLPTTIDPRGPGMGMRSIEHLGQSLLLGCSREEDALRGAILAAPRRSPPAGANMAQMFTRVLVNPLAFTPPAGVAGISRAVDSHDERRCEDLADLLKARAVWQTPTLIRLRTMAFGDDRTYREDPNLRYVSASTRALWNSVADQFAAGIAPDARAALARFFDAQLRLTRTFYDHGVPILAGSDTGGGWVVPGFGLHQEFDLLAKAGLPPLAILQATTINPARFLGNEASAGTIEAGKLADLVLLDADPVRSVAALHRIAGVVHSGVYRSRTDLDKMLAHAATDAASDGATEIEHRD